LIFFAERPETLKFQAILFALVSQVIQKYSRWAVLL